MSGREWQVAEERLAEPFRADQVKHRAGATTKDKTRAMALAYVDARDVMERLDAAVGPAGWSDSYRLVGGMAVECSLTVLGVTKTDVGYPNGADDEEPLKASYSDAFKRASVKFGIGRELYAMPAQWVPYDAEHRRLLMGEPAPERPATQPGAPTPLRAARPGEAPDEGDDEPPPPWAAGPIVLGDAGDPLPYRAGDRHEPSHRPLRARANGALYCPTRLVDGGWCDWPQSMEAGVGRATPGRPLSGRGAGT